jgi:hypothetical protein
MISEHQNTNKNEVRLLNLMVDSGLHSSMEIDTFNNDRRPASFVGKDQEI